ncbi:MAG: glycosyltransferase family 39 protein [Elusimicrobia bacterium]|nr:glycosyltransferase family 39 protein [Candidatus Obscuribacterium magneticum]
MTTKTDSSFQLQLKPVWLLLLPLLVLVFNTRIPGLYIDEIWHFDTAWTFITTGRWAVSGMGDFMGVDKINFQAPVLSLLLALWIKIFGFGVFQAKFLIAILSTFYVYLTFEIFKKLYNETVAVVGTAFAFVWWYHAFRMIRYDLVAGLFFLAAFHMYLKTEEPGRHGWAAFFSGLFSALSPLSHFFGGIGAFSILILMFRRFRFKIFMKKELWLYGLGMAIPLAMFATLILRNWALFIYQEVGLHGKKVNVSSFDFYIDNIRHELIRWFPWPPAETFAFFIPSFIIFLIVVRRNWRDHLHLLTAVFTFFIGYSLFIHNKTPIYLSPVVPFVATGAALLWMNAYEKIGTHLIRRRFCNPRLLQTLFQGGLILFVLVRPAQFMHDIFSKYGYEDTDFDKYIAAVTKFIPPGSTVAGQYIYWMGLRNQPFYHEYYLYRMKEIDHISFAEAVRRKKIDYLIADESLFYYQNDPSVEPFLETHCTLVGTVKNKLYSDIPDYMALRNEAVTRIFKVNN